MPSSRSTGRRGTEARPRSPTAAGAGTGRVLVVGPNLTIDRTAGISRVRAGLVLRTRTVAVTPGGKGVNVVRSVTRLGVAARLVGFTAGRLGEAVAGMLAEEGIVLRAVQAAGEARSALILTDDDGAVTVINEPGPLLRAGDWSRLEAAVAQELERADAVICAGSSPPGTPDDAYARVTALARRAGVPAFVDAGGPLLAAALEAGPTAVLPNLAEAEAVLGAPRPEPVAHGADAGTRALRAAARLRSRGARAAVVTAGAAGAAVAAGGTPVWMAAPAVTATNPVGAGDAFTAGYAAAVLAGAAPPEAAADAVAVAGAAVEHPVAGVLDPERAVELGCRLATGPRRGSRR